MQILIEVKPVQNAGYLKATADLTLTTDHGEITLSKIRVIKKPDAPPWVALPQESYQKNGETKYSEIVTTSKAFKRWLTEQVLAQFNALSPS